MKRRPVQSSAGRWLAGVSLLTLPLLMLLAACSPAAKDRFLRTFFDGYPPQETPQARTAAAAGAADPDERTPLPPAPTGLTWAERISETHEGIAEECSACHGPTKMVSAGLCLECHDLAPHAGQSQYQSCGKCHTEHAGRDADLLAVSSDRCTSCHAFAPFPGGHPQFGPVADPASADRITGLENVHAAHGEMDCTDCHEEQSGGEFGTPSLDGCTGCHDIEDSMVDVDWEVVSGGLAARGKDHRWFDGARFSHAAHEAMDCDGCHTADEDDETALLLPGKNNCGECHNPDGAPADCFACHGYHPAG